MAPTNNITTRPCAKAVEVFGTPELLEHILSFLPARDLLLINRVNSTFHALVDRSQTLGRILFIKDIAHYEKAPAEDDNDEDDNNDDDDDDDGDDGDGDNDYEKVWEPTPGPSWNPFFDIERPRRFKAYQPFNMSWPKAAPGGCAIHAGYHIRLNVSDIGNFIWLKVEAKDHDCAIRVGEGMPKALEKMHITSPALPTVVDIQYHRTKRARTIATFWMKAATIGETLSVTRAVAAGDPTLANIPTTKRPPRFASVFGSESERMVEKKKFPDSVCRLLTSDASYVTVVRKL